MSRRSLLAVPPLVLAGLLVTPAASALGRILQPVLITEKEERELGEAAFKEVLRTSTIDRSASARRRIDRVLGRLARNAGVRNVRWEFAVIVDPSINAFALPAGKIGVYTGLLNFVSDNELAAVLAHEISHVKLRHGAKRVSREMIGRKIRDEISDLANAAGVDSQKTDEALALLGVGGITGVELPFSRTNEHEADREGISVLRRSGFDGVLMRSMIVRLQSVEPSASDWLSTHPSDASRLEEIDRALAKR